MKIEELLIDEYENKYHNNCLNAWKNARCT